MCLVVTSFYYSRFLTNGIWNIWNCVCNVKKTATLKTSLAVLFTYSVIQLLSYSAINLLQRQPQPRIPHTPTYRTPYHRSIKMFSKRIFYHIFLKSFQIPSNYRNKISFKHTKTDNIQPDNKLFLPDNKSLKNYFITI